MSAAQITWISKGKQSCTGPTMTLPEAGGIQRTTCARCSLNYTEPVRSTVAAVTR